MQSSLTGSPATSEVHPLLAFLDRSILRERRMEALWKRASRGPWPEEIRDQFEFEAYEDREHARILRRHRATVQKALGIRKRAPGSRATKVGRTVSPADALSEALVLKAAARAEYAGMHHNIPDRYLRKFVEVLASAEDEALPQLLESAREVGVRPCRPGSRRSRALQALEERPVMEPMPPIEALSAV